MKELKRKWSLQFRVEGFAARLGFRVRGTEMETTIIGELLADENGSQQKLLHRNSIDCTGINAGMETK